VLYPLAPGESELPVVQRFRQDGAVTAFTIQGSGIDDLFILCEEGAGAVTIGEVRFEGRALLLRRKPELQALAVAPVHVMVEGKAILA
jgi:hypothetical protein